MRSILQAVLSSTLAGSVLFQVGFEFRESLLDAKDEVHLGVFLTRDELGGFRVVPKDLPAVVGAPNSKGGLVGSEGEGTVSATNEEGRTQSGGLASVPEHVVDYFGLGITALIVAEVKIETRL